MVAAGSRLAVRKDMAAVWAGSAVGRVVAVGPYSSRVLLLTDPAFRAAVRLGSRGTRGVLVGAGGGRCRVEYVPHDAEIRPSEKVSTAGTDEVFPPAFHVGKCVRVSRKSGELALRVDVVPHVIGQHLDCVEILLWRPAKEPPPVPRSLRGR